MLCSHNILLLPDLRRTNDRRRASKSKNLLCDRPEPAATSTSVFEVLAAAMCTLAKVCKIFDFFNKVIDFESVNFKDL